MDYFTLLTQTGATKITTAVANNTTVNLTHIAVGDGAGNVVMPDASQTALVGETYRTQLTDLKVDDNNSNWLVAVGYIPSDVGNFWVREVGIFDEDGDLIAVGNYPETFKPVMANNVAKDLYISVIMETSNAEAVTLEIDPSVVMASRVYVEDNFATKEHTHDEEYAALGVVSAMQTQIDTHISIPTAYHIYGNLALSDSVITNGFGTVLYTGNGGTQSITTNIDMDTQWGDSPDERYGGLVWLKSRSAATNHFLFDTIRGVEKEINTNTTEVEATLASSLTAFISTGMTLGSAAGVNVSAATYASWNFQTTHRITGTTNHGKAYTCHYNPYTGFTIVKYEGSGIAGHEIPHHLGRKLGFATVKNLSIASQWNTFYGDTTHNMQLNTTLAQFSSSRFINPTTESITIGVATLEVNESTNQFIMYGWANSYFDEANKLIGNYEIGVYQGTGVVAGNKVTTRGKPAWVMIKRIDSTGDWFLLDNQRTGFILKPNSSGAEISNPNFPFYSDGFDINGTDPAYNASGGQYLYMVVYDNDSGSGKSKYPKPSDNPTLNLNAIVPLADGIDSNGSKTTLKVLNETVTGVTLTAGKNYIYRTDTGYGVSTNPPSYGKENPLTGDFFNLITLKWYNSSNVEIEPRNYLDAIVHADHTGNATYVEQLPKTHYFDEVKANEYKGKNATSLSVAFNLSTTPVTIIGDMVGVSSVITTGTGVADIYLNEDVDGTRLKLNGITNGNEVKVSSIAQNKITVTTSNSSGTATSYTYTSINGVGE